MRRELILLTATLVGAAGAGLASAAATPAADGSLAATPTAQGPAAQNPAAQNPAAKNPAAKNPAAQNPAAPAAPPTLTPVPAITRPSSPAATPRVAPAVTPRALPHASPTPTPHRHPPVAIPTPRAVVAPVRPQTTKAVEVQRAMQAVLPGAKVSFEVFDRKTGKVLTSYHADQRFAAMSLVKLLIALDVLARDNRAAPDSATRAALQQLLARSDDQIANRLWSTGGGPAIVTRMISRLGLSGTRPPGDPGEWGDTQITAQDMVTVYRYITDRLPDPDRDAILTALANTPKIALDGFNQYFGIPNGIPNTRRAVKQGWGTSGSQAVMNSTGLVGSDWRYVVIVLVSAPVQSYSTLPAVLTAGASALAGLVSLARS